jgi:Tol biopolymer transport system component/DNA-binding winged helix-turn-helix (wHTH) protein
MESDFFDARRNVMDTKTAYEFGDVTVRPGDFQVSRGGLPLSLEPKSFRVLVHLIENRGRTVSKDDLIQAVWNGTFVTDNALTRVIAQLRRELGDDAKQPRYIETVPTIGYRFVAELKKPAQPAARLKFRPGVAIGATALVLTILMVLLFTKAAPRGDAPAVPATHLRSIRQFTVSPGVDQHPTFSPDGSSIAFSSDRTGRFEIYVQPLANGAREIQITSDGQQNLDPAWSPDGQYIAYYSHSKRGIFIVPALGGIARRLTNFGVQPVWSPDGSTIAFRSGPLLTLVPIDLSPPSITTIWVVPSKGGTPRELTPHDRDARDSFPSWSPDGQSIVFSRLSGSDPGLWSVSVTDGALKRVANSPETAWYPTYDRDGTSIFFAARSAGAGFSIWNLKVADGANPQEVLTAGLALPRDLSIDRKGRSISYSLGTMSSSLYSLDLMKGESKALVDDRSFRNTLPMFSPAGDRVAYLVQRLGQPGNIWIMNPDGSNPTRLTQNDRAEWMAGWLDGGRRIGFGSMDNKTNTLWAASLADGSISRLSALPGRTWVLLSPEGREIVFHSSNNDSLNIAKMDLSTMKTTQLTFDKEAMSFPSWSRDGQWIAFETWRGEDSFLTVMDRQGGHMTQLTHEPGHSWAYSWSPDGHRIAFAGLRDGAWNLFTISVDGTSQQKLTSHTSLASFVRYPTWSPKGNQIIYEFAETKANIFVAQLP